MGIGLLLWVIGTITSKYAACCIAIIFQDHNCYSNTEVEV